jgi:DNA modification methylase
MDIELRSTDLIKPYPGNPRLNDAAVDAVAASLREFGFRQPIVVDGDGVIIAGHTRYRAALKLGLAKVPVHVAKDLSPAQVKAYRLADNQTATLAEWNYELLPIEIRDLQGMNFDLGVLGFSETDLGELLAPAGTEGLTDPDAVPEPPDEAVTRPGDLWILGNHRLLCGDSSKPEDLDRLLGGAKIHLVNTDPPYNVNLAPRTNNAILAGAHGLPHDVAEKVESVQGYDVHRLGVPKIVTRKLRPRDRVLANDFLSDDEFYNQLVKWFGNMARVLEPGRGFYVWGGYLNWPNYCPALAQVGLYFSQGITWVKHHPVLGRTDMMNDCEHCWYGWKEGGPHQWIGPNNISNIWEVKKVNPADMVHLTEKPVELAVRAIEYSSRPGENVLDLFGGSGSTLIGCEKTGRRAHLMELDALYCDVIVKRWEDFTGKKAECQAANAPAGETPEQAAPGRQGEAG